MHLEPGVPFVQVDSLEDFFAKAIHTIPPLDTVHVLHSKCKLIKYRKKINGYQRFNVKIFYTI